MSKKEMVCVGISQWPTELVAKAEYEFALFDKPSIDTCTELLAEVKSLRIKLAKTEKMLRDINELENSSNLVTSDCESGIPTKWFEEILSDINDYFK